MEKGQLPMVESYPGTCVHRLGRAASLALLAVAAVCATGCGWLPGGPTLTIDVDGVPSSLDPHLQNESAAWSVLGNFYEGLIRFTPEMQVQPGLATSWTWLDPTRLRLDLRPGVLFHDGTELTSHDVVASLDRARLHPRSLVRHYMTGVRKVTAQGSRTVIIEMVAASPTLLNRLVFVLVVPRSLAGGEEIARPVGTGAYRFSDRGTDGSITATAWSKWWGGPVPVRRARLAFVEEDERREKRFSSGEADVSPRLADGALVALKNRDSLRVVAQPRLGVQMLVVMPRAARGIAGKALADSRVRRAILLATDREGLVSRVFRGHGTVASQYVHPAVFGFDPVLEPLPYDPASARRLLADAGFAQGFTVELGYGPLPSEYVADLTSDLARVGIRITTVRFPLGELFRRTWAGELPLATWGRQCTTGDAAELFDATIHSPDLARGLGGENRMSWSDPVTDALLDAARQEVEPARRRTLLQQAQRRVLADLPVLPLTLRTGFMGLSKRIDVTPRTDGWLVIADMRWR